MIAVCLCHGGSLDILLFLFYASLLKHLMLRIKMDELMHGNSFCCWNSIQIVGRSSDGVEGEEMDHNSLVDGYVRMT